MCGGGGGRSSAPDNSEQLALQKEQMAEQKRQFELQRAESRARYEETRRMNQAEAPPAPSATADVAAPTLDIKPGSGKAGYGRKKFRSGGRAGGGTNTTVAGGTGGLNIP